MDHIVTRAELRNRKALLLSLIIGVGPFTGSLNGEPLKLAQAAQLVLQASAFLKKAESGLSESKAALSELRSSYLPGLAVSGSFTRGNNPVYSFGTLLTQSRFGMADFALDRLNSPDPVNNLQGQAGLQVALLNLQRDRHLTAARAWRKMAEEGTREARQRLLYQTIEGFYGLALARAQGDVLEERIAESEKEIADALRLKEQGLVLGSDYHLARSILGQMKQQRLAVDAQAETARAALNILMGREENEPLDIAGSLSAGAFRTVDFAAGGGTLENNPVLLGAGHAVSRFEAEAQAESRGLLPTLSGFSSVEGNGDRFDRGGWNYMAGVKLGIPLFDPGHVARLRQRRASLEGARAERQSALDQLKVEFRKSAEFYRSARERLPLAKETADEAADALKSFRALYKNGRQSIADVMQGELALTQALFSLNQSHFDLRTGYARLLLLSGRLDAVPEELQ